MDKHDDNEREGQDKPRVVISDMRHSRAEDYIEDTQPVEEPPVDEPIESEVVEPVEPETVEQAETKAEAPDLSVVEPEEPAPVSEPQVPDSPQQEPPEGESGEMEQLRQIFGIGITQYIGSQIGILINFALIYMGRAANPASGLVSIDLEKAKMSIDLLEFIVSKIQGELAEQEQANLTNLLADLKYSFMQAASEGGTPPEGPTTG